MKIKGQLLWMLILLTFTSPAFASNLYTSSTGSDTSNNCQNIATPCNLNNGFANEMAQVVAGRGDVIFMCAGACDGAGSANVSAAIASDAYTIPNGTDWSNALTIQAYPGEVITLSGRGAGSAATISLFSGNQYVIFSGFGINYNGLSGHTSGIYVSGSDTNHIRFQRMEVQNYTQDGITLWMGTHHIELLNVNSHDNGSAPTLAFPFQDHCIYIEHADDVLIDGGQYHNCAYGYGSTPIMQPLNLSEPLFGMRNHTGTLAAAFWWVRTTGCITTIWSTTIPAGSEVMVSRWGTEAQATKFTITR